MSQLSSTELANQLRVSKGRVSQYVAEGKLAGCFIGDGRARRFDLAKVATALGKTLDQGQMLGNGAKTRKAISDLSAQIETSADTLPLRRDERLAENDPDRYKLAQTAKAEEELRKLRRQNQQDEGSLVLTSEVERQVSRMIAQEVAEVETVLRDGSRAIADRMGVDFKTVRQILIETWREHRKGRSAVLEGEAEGAEMSAAEVAANI